ncbi:hypothetical protein [Muricoccus vinaceus]|uniref:Uncharacterized protein n=1 Tax=Muricoccus vinaceus TaxID=424704 RepID=A0ABV6J1L1_9PROT
MHRLNEAGRVVSLYVGKARRSEREGSMSANLTVIPSNGSKLGRWGYGYAYHLGDLSAARPPHRACDSRRASGAQLRGWDLPAKLRR